jgi:hypothetical protein
MHARHGLSPGPTEHDEPGLCNMYLGFTAMMRFWAVFTQLMVKILAPGYIFAS